MKVKKKIAIILLTVAASLSLTACGKFTCDICGEEKSGKSYKETLLGEKITVCKDCHEGLEALNKLFGN